VTKKALCMSEGSVEDRLKQADSCTIAVAFLGTPHRGSSFALFAKSFTNILKAVRIRANSDILEPLGRESQVLEDVEDSFAIWLRKKGGKFNMTCFFEELELKSVGLVSTLALLCLKAQ
jgi:protein SERAC1